MPSIERLSFIGLMRGDLLAAIDSGRKKKIAAFVVMPGRGETIH